MSLRELYRSLERPGVNPLKDAHAMLDEAVRVAHEMGKRDITLGFLFELNVELFERELASVPCKGGCTCPGCHEGDRRVNSGGREVVSQF